MRRSIPRRAVALDQLLDDRRAERLPRPRPPQWAEAREPPQQRPTSGSRRNLRWNSPRSSSTRGRSACARSPARAAPGRPAAAPPAASSGGRRRADGCTASARSATRREPAARPGPAPGCRRRGAVASPPRGPPAACDPRCRARGGTGGRCTKTSRPAAGAAARGSPRSGDGHRAAYRPSRWTSTRKSDWRRPWPDAAGGGEPALAARARAGRGDGAHRGPRSRRRRARLRPRDPRRSEPPPSGPAAAVSAWSAGSVRTGSCVAGLGVFLGQDLAVYVEFAHQPDSSGGQVGSSGWHRKPRRMRLWEGPEKRPRFVARSRAEDRHAFHGSAT